LRELGALNRCLLAKSWRTLEAAMGWLHREGAAGALHGDGFMAMLFINVYVEAMRV
jgi:hypothetical protein